MLKTKAARMQFNPANFSLTDQPDTRDGSLLEPTSGRFVLAAAVAVGVVCFLATELLRYLLVPDIGRNRERIVAEILTALIVGCLTAKLIQIARARQQLNVARMQVVAEMNHHIRNALSPVSLSLDASENEKLKAVISDAVDRIEWTLREILPREIPLKDEQRHKLGYFQKNRGSGETKAEFVRRVMRNRFRSG